MPSFISHYFFYSAHVYWSFPLKLVNYKFFNFYILKANFYKKVFLLVDQNILKGIYLKKFVDILVLW
jgi:hypothetical protein